VKSKRASEEQVTGRRAEFAGSAADGGTQRAAAETPAWRVRTRTRASPKAVRLTVSFPRLARPQPATCSGTSYAAASRRASSHCRADLNDRAADRNPRLI